MSTNEENINKEENKENNNNVENKITLDSEIEIPKKQLKISLTTFIFIIMFFIVMILAAIQGLIYLDFTGI